VGGVQVGDCREGGVCRARGHKAIVSATTKHLPLAAPSPPAGWSKCCYLASERLVLLTGARSLIG